MTRTKEGAMRRRTGLILGSANLLLATAVVGCGAGSEGASDGPTMGTSSSDLSTTLENNTPFDNPTGQSSSFSTAGSVDLTGAFFQNLGTNGRTCNTCHLASDGWTVAARSAQQIFDATGGNAPLFQFDGQNCRGADRSTIDARRTASSLMLNKALVRFDKTFPQGGDIEIAAAEGTYCNVTDTLNHVVFRRPLPTVNFGAIGTSLWDGLGNFIAPTARDAIPLIFIGATLLHAQSAAVPTNDQVANGLSMMLSLTNAQVFDDDAKDLTAAHALGGAENLASLSLTGSPGFTIYDAWTSVPGAGTEAARRSVAHGEQIFDTRPINITGVGGLSDRTGTCSGCHRVPNMGNQSTFNTLAIGVADAAHRTPDLPLYTLRNTHTGETTQTSDAGTAIITGRWEDIGKFKPPALRGLAARAPYFHNGIAATLEDVVEFYDARFNMGLDGQDEEDLIAFLKTL
jgi:cytochrome c peroxidase